MISTLELQRALRTGEGPERVQQLIDRLDLIRHKVQPAALRRYQYGRPGSGETPLEAIFSELYVPQMGRPLALEVSEPVMIFKVHFNPFHIQVGGSTPIRLMVSCLRGEEMDPGRDVPTMEQYLRWRLLHKKMAGLEVQSIHQATGNALSLPGEPEPAYEVDVLIPWKFTLTQEEVGL